MPTNLKQDDRQLLAEIMVDVAGLAAENERLRAALKDIYHRSKEAEVRNMAWDAAERES